MSLTINVQLNTSDGGTISEGSLVKFSTFFPISYEPSSTSGDITYDVEFSLEVYRSQTDFDNGKSKILNIDDFPLTKTISMTQAEYIALTPVTIHELLRDWILEEMNRVGEDIIDIVI